MNDISNKKIVIALGGNAITREGGTGDIHEQFANSRRSLAGVADMIADGYPVAITHGNGPQIGNELIRVELSKHAVPELPLGVLVGDTEGGMGYMLEQCLQNILRDKKVSGVKIATLVTQVLVDRNDPSVSDPTKFVGPFYGKEDADRLAQEKGWVIKEDPGRGFRRVVPSPLPLGIINKDAIRTLTDNGFTIIAAGGGGIPVYIDERGWYEGIDAVVDKDLASAVLARDISADTLVLLTSVDAVALNFRKPNERFLGKITIEEAKRYRDEGHFPPGSMGPKITAAIEFLESGGEDVTITSPELLTKAVMGQAGTRIIK